MQPNQIKRLGMLTPSSNTVLEPATAAMLRDVSDVTAHFGRFPVLKITLENDAMHQFNAQPMLDAAQMLADAKTHVICWNGTSSGWLGFDTDEELCAQIKDKTGTVACSSVLALNELLSLTNAKKIAFVTPYLNAVQQRIIENYQSNGFTVVAEEHLQDEGNFSFCSYTEEHITQLCRSVALEQPDAICIFCTNFRGASVAPLIEKETGIPVYDTVSTALWKSLQLAGISPSVIKGWGGLFNV